MQISITARHFNLTEKVRVYIEKSCEHFSHYFQEIINVDTTMTYSKKEKNHMDVKMSIHASKANFRSEATEADIFNAIDMACLKIEKQLKKNREKRVSHHLKKKEKYSKRVLTSVYHKEKQTKKKQIKTEKIFADTMTLDQAIETMDNNKLLYFIFNNTVSDRINILVKKDDEHYKLIEA